MPKNKQEPDKLAVQISRLAALRLIADRKNRVSAAAKTKRGVEADTLLLLIVNCLEFQHLEIAELRGRAKFWHEHGQNCPNQQGGEDGQT